MTAPAPLLAGPVTDAGDALNHFYCCDENRALCGTDLTGHAEVAEVTCVVCVDLDDAQAPCGPACSWAVAA